jgi:hypothetical protein
MQRFMVQPLGVVIFFMDTRSVSLQDRNQFSTGFSSYAVLLNNI